MAERLVDNNHPQLPASRKLNINEDPARLAKYGYDAEAQTYLNWTSSLTNLRPLWLEKLFNRIEGDKFQLRSSRCLDLGCGPGVTGTLKLAQQCGHVVAVDISARQIELTKSGFEAAELPLEKYILKEADMMNLDYARDSFDIVCAFYSIIHLPLPAQEVLLARIYEWLVPGGYLLMNAATEPSPVDGSVSEGWLNMTAYWASFGRDGTLEIVKNIGFGIVETEDVSTSGDSAFTWIIAMKPHTTTAGSV